MRTKLLGGALAVLGCIALVLLLRELAPGGAFVAKPFIALYLGTLASYAILCGSWLVAGPRALVPLVLAGGLAYIFHLKWLAPIDEVSHLAVIALTAKHGVHPRLDAPAPDAIIALGEGRYPGPPSRPAKEIGFGGYAYQAVHPPLYHYLSAQVFAFSPKDLLRRHLHVRIFSLLLLVLAAAVLVRAAERFFPDAQPSQQLQIFALAAALLLAPGLLLRAVTLGNMTLAVLLGAVLLWIRAVEAGQPGRWDDRAAGWRRGLVCGALFVTHVFAYPVIAAEFVALALARRWRVLAWCVPISLACLAPWVASNLVRYGAITGAALSKSLQVEILNPGDKPLALEAVVRDTYHVFDAFWKAQEQNPLPHAAIVPVFLSAFFILCLVVAVQQRWQDPAEPRQSTRIASLLAILGTPILLYFVCLVERLPLFVGRYLHATIPALFCVALESSGTLPIPWRLATSHALLLGIAALWWNYLMQLLLPGS